MSRGKYSDPHTRTAFTAVDHGVLLRRFLSFFLSFFLRANFIAVVSMLCWSCQVMTMTMTSRGDVTALLAPLQRPRDSQQRVEIDQF